MLPDFQFQTFPQFWINPPILSFLTFTVSLIIKPLCQSLLSYVATLNSSPNSNNIHFHAKATPHTYLTNMATSAFKSTTKRASIGEDSAHRSLRRSRSLSRPTAPDPDYIKNVPRGEFVNTTRGTATAPFPEISLDDLALDFFSSSSKTESDGGGRFGEIGRWASDTASSRRRGRSVSRSRGDAVSISSAASGPNIAASSDGSSRRRRSVSVARNRGNAAPAADKDDAGTRRRRSLSVARYHISDSESDSSNRATMIVPNGGNTRLPLASKTTSSSYHRLGRSTSQIDLSLIHDGYSMEKRKMNLLTEMLLEEQCGVEVCETYEDLPNSRASAVTEKLPQARKRSSDRSRMSERLIEDAERYFEDFISNIEDTDLSSFDGERSDGSSTLGGMVKGREFRIGEAETCRTPARPTSRPGEMDGVILPWLQWETSHDGSPGGKTKVQTPMTPRSVQRDLEKDSGQLHDASSYSMSSHGSWSPGLVHSSPMDKREEVYPTKTGNICVSKFDMDEYLDLQNNEEILFEMYRERIRIGLGGLLLCTGVS
ncbi:uncharacterized protein LOC125197541 isoform X3 [Salvia hispanica]|uniref:uncharacterized protein LOC125197541 isoform X3 n=1 Tax=Salvia hispanica TaxID=49212 RepID=UPI00200956AF|nr:uncharacterized protein LOC125197541 isoform X3 [Salvia hispanica]